MKKNHTIAIALLLAALLSTFTPLQLCAQVPAAQISTNQAPLWKITHTELQNDDRLFVGVLERSTLTDDQRNSFQIKKMAFAIRSDNSLLTYQPLKAQSASEIITIDLSNIKTCSDMMAIIADFKQVDKSNKEDPNVQTANKINIFSSAKGDFDVSYDTGSSDGVPDLSGAYGGCINLHPTGSSLLTPGIIIYEPTALEQVLRTIDNLRQMQKDAIKAKEEQLASQKALQAEQAQDELAKAKADIDEKAKIDAAIKQQQLAEQETEQRIQAAKDAAVEAQHNKALEFLATPDGKSMVQNIKSLDTEIKALDEKERRLDYGNLLDKKDALDKQLHDYHLTNDERTEVSRDFANTIMDIGNASGNHVPSDKLKRMTSNFSLLLTQFQEKAGMPYGDVMALKR